MSLVRFAIFIVLVGGMSTVLVGSFANSMVTGSGIFDAFDDKELIQTLMWTGMLITAVNLTRMYSDLKCAVYANE